MQNEISSGTMLGIVLIALAAVIGLGFGVFSIAKGVSNEGVVNVQDNLGTVSDSAYQDYDQKVITGTQVVAAYKAFQGKPIGILINTQAMNKSVKTAPNHKAYAFTVGTSTQYLNYNALFSTNASTNATGTILNSSGTTPVAVATGTPGIVTILTDGTYSTSLGFALDSNAKVAYDSNTGGFSKAGNCEYISSSAKFDSSVIYDASGEIVGLIFTQLTK